MYITATKNLSRETTLVLTDTRCPSKTAFNKRLNMSSTVSDSSKGSTPSAVRRLKRYGVRGSSPTPTVEESLGDKKKGNNCCKGSPLTGRIVALILWMIIFATVFLCFRLILYGGIGEIGEGSKLEFGGSSASICPPLYKTDPWYYYYDENGNIHCYWFATLPNAKRLTWWNAKKECESLKSNLNNAAIGTKVKPGKKIKKSYLFIPETGNEFHRVAAQLTRLQQYNFRFQVPNLTYHNDDEFWIGGRKCIYGYPKDLTLSYFMDYLWITTDKSPNVYPQNVFCQTGLNDFRWTTAKKTIPTKAGDVKKTVVLSGECWDVERESPQKRVNLLEKRYNVWTDRFQVEKKKENKRLLELEESIVLTSYRNYFLEDSPKKFLEANPQERHCNFTLYARNNKNIQALENERVPFCINLATHFNQAKRLNYDERIQPEWTWYSYPCHWKSFFICEAEMETDPDLRRENKKKYKAYSKTVKKYWNKVPQSQKPKKKPK